MPIASSNIRGTTRWLCVSALFMALNVVMSSFGVPVPGGHLYLNDIIIDVLHVFNMRGQSIKVKGLNELNTGIYILQGLTKDGQMVSRKVVVNK